jgi:hypothetical protein
MNPVKGILMGVGLVVLGIFGLGTAPTTHWLMWLDIVVGLVCFASSFGELDEGQGTAGPGAATGMAVALFVFWFFGLLTRAVAWESWVTFTFACAFSLAALGQAGSLEERASDVDLSNVDIDIHRRAS